MSTTFTSAISYIDKTRICLHGSRIIWYSCRLIVTRRVSHVEQEQLLLPDHVSSPPVISGVHVAWSLVFCVVYCRSLFVHLFFGHCVVCPSIYGSWLPLWYLRFTAADYPFDTLDLRHLITPLAPSNFSYKHQAWQHINPGSNPFRCVWQM